MSHYEERAFMNEEMARDIDDPLQDAERKIARLSAELTEARELIAAAHDYLSCDWFPHKSRNGNDKAAIEARARAFLTKGEADA